MRLRTFFANDGDCLLLTSDSGKNALVDGGHYANTFRKCMGNGPLNRDDITITIEVFAAQFGHFAEAHSAQPAKGTRALNCTVFSSAPSLSAIVCSSTVVGILTFFFGFGFIALTI